MNILFSTLASFFIFSTAQAYIPPTQFIFDKVAGNHGKGPYIVETEVNFHEGVENFNVRENWLVGDGGDMRVSAIGAGANIEGFKLFRILKRNRVYWLDGNSHSEHAEEASPDFYMMPILDRSGYDLKRLFVKWGVLPPETLVNKRTKDIKDIKDAKELLPEPESYVRLARSGGAVTYTYGKPAPADGALPPGLWIEQDTFLIRKMRTPSGAEILANEYIPYSKNLWFPRTQVITFDNHIINIRTLRVTSIELTRDQKNQLEPSYLRGRVDSATSWPKSSLATLVQEFYKRFR